MRTILALAFLLFSPALALAQSACAPIVSGFDSEIYNAPTDGTVIELQDRGHRLRKGYTMAHFGLFKFSRDSRFVDPGWLSLDSSTFFRFDTPCLAWRAYSGDVSHYTAPDGKSELERQCAYLRAKVSPSVLLPMCNGVK